MKALLPVIVSLSIASCTQSIGRFAVVSEPELPPNGLLVRPARTPTERASEECINTIVIFPDRLRINLERLAERAECARGPLRDVEIERWYWVVPFVGGQDCLRIVRRCSA